MSFQAHASEKHFFVDDPLRKSSMMLWLRSLKTQFLQYYRRGID